MVPQTSSKIITWIIKTWVGWFYNLVVRFDRDRIVSFMNYGYTDLDPSAEKLPLSPQEEKVRFEIQLYHRMASAADWNGKDGLEVGSGRGGGAAFITQRFHPRSMTGLDLSEQAVIACNQKFASVPGLRFIQGDAEAIPLEAESVDIVLNLESSIYYPNFPLFLKNVYRVLRPNGLFLYADMRYASEIDGWRAQLLDSGLQLIREEDISPNTKKAVALMQQYRREQIDRYLPAIFRPLFHKYSGADGRRLLSGSKTLGERLYYNFVLRKPAG